MGNNSKFYKTAQAKIGCAKFPAGAFVSVKFSHHTENGTEWYQICKAATATKTMEFEPVMYPAHHLKNFVL